MPIFWLDNRLIFPHPAQAESSGILAAGGDLNPDRLLLAYRSGIFPWFNEDDPIIWWSPDPRFVLFPSELVIARSMRPYFNQSRFRISVDTCFEMVIRACGNQPRSGQNGSWITDDMVNAYRVLHRLGYAHSVEVWEGNSLVGGLYGIALGRIFFGESMFSKSSNASKFGFISLVRRLQALGYSLIDCQQETRHLGSLGARSIARAEFLDQLDAFVNEDYLIGDWSKMKEFQNLAQL
jgi:leucyl/phenylalanyl-tRNA--protein transferase